MTPGDTTMEIPIAGSTDRPLALAAGFERLTSGGKNLRAGYTLDFLKGESGLPVPIVVASGEPYTSRHCWLLNNAPAECWEEVEDLPAKARRIAFEIKARLDGGESAFARMADEPVLLYTGERDTWAAQWAGQVGRVASTWDAGARVLWADGMWGLACHTAHNLTILTPEEVLALLNGGKA